MSLLVGCLLGLLAQLPATGAQIPRVSLWGPGLRGDFVLPVRYIFIQFTDENNQRLAFVENGIYSDKPSRENETSTALMTCTHVFRTLKIKSIMTSKALI